MIKKFITFTFPILIACNAFIVYYEWDQGKMRHKENRKEFFIVKSVLYLKDINLSQVIVMETVPVVDGKKTMKYGFFMPYTPKELRKLGIPKKKKVQIFSEILSNKSLKHEKKLKQIIVNDNTYELKNVERILY